MNDCVKKQNRAVFLAQYSLVCILMLPMVTFERTLQGSQGVPLDTERHWEEAYVFAITVHNQQNN